MNRDKGERTMQRRHLLIAAGAALAAPPAMAQTRPETARLALGFGLDPVFAPHIVAMQKGWLREAGFTDVTTRSFTGGALAGEALLANEIQLWTPGNLPPISMAHTGIPIVVLGTNCIATEAENLVARKDANIRAPEDLYRIRIGLLAGSTASATLSNLAKHYNLDERRLQVVNMPPPEQLAALNGNQIGALLCWQPWGYNALRSDAMELIHSGTRSNFSTNRGAAVQISATRSLFVASQEFVRRNPNATRALVAVLLRAQKYVADPANRAEVLPLVAQETRQPRELVEAIWDEYVFNPVFDQAYVADMENMTQYLVSSGRVRQARNPLDYTFTDPLAAADPALVRVPGRWRG
jgi:ABC-type nitrate/sulfonate/bicarbonate transport system substrate-binding protein